MVGSACRPVCLATVLLLQTHDKVSDAEAKARADFDIRWKVALGIEIEDRPFAKSTLQVFRAQLILHDKVREVFEQSLRLAREARLPEGEAWDAGGDGYDLHPGARGGEGHLQSIGRRHREADAVAWRRWRVCRCGVGRRAQGYQRYVGSSVKGEAAIDWSNRRARRRLLGQIVADADRLLELARQAQDALDADSSRAASHS